jgi:hypothetical protein
MPRRKFTRGQAAAIDEIKYLRIRSGDHRFIGIWVVVADGRVFVRSWNDKRGGWFRAFLEEPKGAIMVGDKEVSVRAIPVKSEKLKDAVDRAYGDKYTTKANQKYVKGFATAKRRSATAELVPL